MSVVNKFNDGELTSSSIDRQFRPEAISKMIVEIPQRKKFFSKLSNREAMPKNHGDKLTKEVRLPMLNKDNMVDGGIDATTATLILNEFYGYNAGGALIITVNAEQYAIEKSLAFGTEPEKRAVADAIQTDINDGSVTYGGNTVDTSSVVTVKSGAGSILNGSASYLVSSAQLAPLPEEGGVVNLLNSSSKLITAKITFHGAATKYTVRSVELDSRRGQVATKVKDLARAVAETKEMQIQNSLLGSAYLNTMISTTNPAVVTIDEMDSMDVISYDSLVALEQELRRDDVPMDTEMLTGTNLTDTRVVEDAYIAYVNLEVVPTLQAMTGPGGALVWKDKSTYGAAITPLEGERGSIGAFRFVVVPDLQVERGAGETVGADNSGNVGDSGNAATQAATFKTAGKYDVFTMMVVGDDSFSITGFGGESTSAKHIAPRADVHNDIYGEVGGVSAKWSYGYLPYRPERIKALKFVVNRTGKNPA